MPSTQLRCGAISLRNTLPAAQFFRANDILAATCAADWRACRAGDVFFAVTTAADDGHEHVAEAAARGASAVIAERLLPIDLPQAIVRDSRSALARVCQALAGNPSRSLKTVGIAGTAGKTVTAMLVASIFEAAGQVAGVMSSIGNSDSLDQHAATSHTPTAPEFATWLGRMKSAGCAGAVLELSSQALAERRTSGIELDAAVLTNIKSSAAGHAGSLRAYSDILRRIFKQSKAGGLAILNADDYRCRNLLDGLHTPCLSYALHAEADVTARVLERFPSEQTFLLSAGSDTAPVRTRMIGDHHVSNCLAAAAVGLGLGFEWEAIVRGLEAVDRVPCRLERLECGQPFSVFVDAGSTPETLSLSVKTVRQVTGGRVITVFGPAGDVIPASRAMSGRVLERGAHLAILTGDAGTGASSLAEIHDVLDGFERPHKAQVIPNRATAIRHALSLAEPGDAVLLAGQDAATTDLSNQNESAQDDREIACEWLYSQGESRPMRPRFRVIG